MTEKLFGVIRDLNKHDKAKGCLPSLMWGPLRFAVPGNAKRMLGWIPEGEMQPERIFDVDGLRLHIAAEVEPFIQGQVLDWVHKKGLVSYAV